MKRSDERSGFVFTLPTWCMNSAYQITPLEVAENFASGSRSIASMFASVILAGQPNLSCFCPEGAGGQHGRTGDAGGQQASALNQAPGATPIGSRR